MLELSPAIAAGGPVAPVSVSGGNLTWVVIVAVVALLALAVAGVLVREVLAASQGTAKMQEIAKAVQEGAAAYLRQAVPDAGRLRRPHLLRAAAAARRRRRACAGAAASSSWSARCSPALTGFTGMSLCVRGNVRVAAAAREGGERPAMRIAFRTGGVAGMFTVGLGLFGAAIVVLIYKANAPDVLEGFGFGAALLAMFMRVGGGIYTKAADVGADLVGKVEQGIPEDDPRNAATIADNVGDNVGDCAGMAADLFESYAVMLVASLILGKTAFGDKGLIFPLIVPMIGVITAVIGIFVGRAARARPQRDDRDQPRLLHLGGHLASIGVAVFCFTFLPTKFSALHGHHRRRRSSQLQRQPAVARHRRGRSSASCWRQRHPAADRVLHRDQPAAGPGHRGELADRRGHRDPVRHLVRHGVRRLLGAADRRGRVRRVPAGHRQRHHRAVRGGAWPAPAC